MLVTFSPLALVIVVVTVRLLPSGATTIVPVPTTFPPFLLVTSIVFSPVILNARVSEADRP